MACIRAHARLGCGGDVVYEDVMSLSDNDGVDGYTWWACDNDTTVILNGL